MSDHITDRVAQVIRERISAGNVESYVASLHALGPGKIRKKVQEEAGEVLEASVRLEHGGKPEDLANEAADLLFHLLVLLEAQAVGAEAVWTVLEGRFGTSGLVEKASRG